LEVSSLVLHNIGCDTCYI